MSIWSKVQTLPPELANQVASLYGPNFPLVVRNCLSSYIEEWIFKWNELYNRSDIDYNAKELYAHDFFTALIEKIKAQSCEQQDYCLRLQLIDASTRFTNLFSSNPMSLINLIRDCLMKEEKIVQNVILLWKHFYSLTFKHVFPASVCPLGLPVMDPIVVGGSKNLNPTNIDCFTVFCREWRPV